MQYKKLLSTFANLVRQSETLISSSTNYQATRREEWERPAVFLWLQFVWETSDRRRNKFRAKEREKHFVPLMFPSVSLEFFSRVVYKLLRSLMQSTLLWFDVWLLSRHQPEQDLPLAAAARVRPEWAEEESLLPLVYAGENHTRYTRVWERHIVCVFLISVFFCVAYWNTVVKNGSKSLKGRKWRDDEESWGVVNLDLKEAEALAFLNAAGGSCRKTLSCQQFVVKLLMREVRNRQCLVVCVVQYNVINMMPRVTSHMSARFS